MAVQLNTDKTKKDVKVNHRYQRDKDREKVRGIFHFYEVPGGVMEFSYRKYKEDEVETYSLVDNEIYELPLGVAKHLNNDCWYPEYEYFKEGGEVRYSGVQASGQVSPRSTMRIARKVKRCSFQSLEFVDVDELSTVNNPIIQVEKVVGV